MVEPMIYRSWTIWAMAQIRADVPADTQVRAVLLFAAAHADDTIHSNGDYRGAHLADLTWLSSLDREDVACAVDTLVTLGYLEFDWAGSLWNGARIRVPQRLVPLVQGLSA